MTNLYQAVEQVWHEHLFILPQLRKYVFRICISSVNDKLKSNHAYFTFVAIDLETGKPVKVPPLQPETEDEKARYESANRRKEVRLIISKRLKPKDAKEIIDYFADFQED